MAEKKAGLDFPEHMFVISVIVDHIVTERAHQTYFKISVIVIYTYDDGSEEAEHHSTKKRKSDEDQYDTDDKSWNERHRQRRSRQPKILLIVRFL